MSSELLLLSLPDQLVRVGGALDIHLTAEMGASLLSTQAGSSNLTSVEGMLTFYHIS